MKIRKGILLHKEAYMFEELRTAINKRDEFAQRLGIEVKEISDDYAIAEMPFDERQKNGLGNVHGAASYALADLAFAAASMSHGDTTVTITSSLNYIAAGHKGPIRAEARVVSQTRKLCTVEIKITDGNGNLIAFGVTEGYRTGGRFLENN